MSVFVMKRIFASIAQPVFGLNYTLNEGGQIAVFNNTAIKAVFSGAF
jgi:hypothetical protein